MWHMQANTHVILQVAVKGGGVLRELTALTRRSDTELVSPSTSLRTVRITQGLLLPCSTPKLKTVSGGRANTPKLKTVSEGRGQKFKCPENAQGPREE